MRIRIRIYADKEPDLYALYKIAGPSLTRKIFKDSLENKLRGYIQIEEDYEDLKEKVRIESGRFMKNDRKDNEIKNLRRENSNIKKEVSKIKKIC